MYDRQGAHLDYAKCVLHAHCARRYRGSSGELDKRKSQIALEYKFGEIKNFVNNLL